MSRKHIWSGTTNDEPSTPAEDAAFKEKVRQQCLANGGDAELCDVVADRALNTPAEGDSPDLRAQMAAARDYLDRLRRICAIYGPRAVALVAEFRTSGLTLREVGAVLAEVTGSARELSENGAGAIALRLLSATHWRH
jgi:hypothetical protein